MFSVVIKSVCKSTGAIIVGVMTECSVVVSPGRLSRPAVHEGIVYVVDLKQDQEVAIYLSD